MQSEKETNYKLIKQKHIVPAIIRLLLTYVLLIVLAIFISDMAISYLCDANLESEYKAVKYMAGLYENATDKDSIQSLLEQEDRDFLVVDPNGNVLKSKGENTCSFNGGMVTASGIDRDFNVYYNSTDNVWSVSSNKDFDISFNKAYNQVKEYELISQIFSSSDGKNVAVPLYYWISIDFLDGSGSFVGKAAYEVKTRDIGLILLFIFILSSLAVALFIALLVRIVKRFSRQRKLLSVFFTDVVTKGHNWMWFTIKGEQQLRKKKNDKLNFALLNIVFVKYNTYCVCHSVEEGERALQAVNRTISKSINKYEACAHHGTSSFAVLMQYSDEEMLKKKVKFILRHLESVESVHKFAFHVGIALMPAILESDGKYARRTKIDIEKIYHNACAASATLESSDDSAIAFFDDKLVEEQKWIDHVVEKQQQAIDNEEFLIYYQPKYDPSTDTLRGAEALIRWQSPDYGFVTPGRIIPIFEKNGFITEIDHYMLTHVARDQKRWLDKGFKCVPVSVNVSRAHFIESDLAEQIRDAVDKEGAPHELIEIELTESAFFDDKKALITTIEKLKSYGFSVSMDDFGAGYSSLNSLKDMPLDVLKLDADFFRGESEGNRGEIVVSEAIRLAKALNMRTVAEGVEVKEQVEFLAKQGCDMIQGYYYAKPMIGTDYEQRMGMMGEQPEEDNLKPKQITIQDMNQDSFMPEAEKSVETPVESSGLDVADNLSGESSSIVAESLAIEGVSATVGSLITEGDSAVADKTAIEDVSDVAGSLIAEGVSAAADNLMTESGLKVCSSTPKSDGFYMPGEFEPHKGTIMIWPERPGSWPYGAKAARKAFAQIIETIAENEEVFVAVSEKGYESAEETLKEIKNVKLFVADTDDAWARDVAPTFVKNGEGNVRAVNWSFNAWGGTYNGLYASWEKDDAFAKFFAEKEGYDLYDAAPFVLEGGSIHSDGEGTVIVTGECLLSPGRNPQLSKEEIEQKLKEYLGAEKVIWLPNGIYNDETDGHVDNICAFIRPSEVVLAWTDDENDPQYALSSENLKILESETDAKGRNFTVHKLPIPKTPVVVGEEDIKGYEFEAGEDEREVGERLAASYVNFYFSNGAVIVPAFGGENEENDSEAAKILAELCPDRKVVQIPARDILLGGGNIHCITQQIPQ